MLEALRLGLREHGWIEQQNIDIDFRWGHGESDRLGRLADELVRIPVEVLIAPTTQAIQACKRATTALPIIMIAANDPVGDGLVNSLARPGGNITGLIYDSGLELGAKHVDLLRQAIPTLARIAVIGNPENPSYGRMVEAVRTGARPLRIALTFHEARVPAEVKATLDAAATARPGAMLILSDGLLFGQRRTIADFAASRQLPVIYPWKDAAAVGGFMTYGANLAYNFRRAGSVVDRILKGAQPANLPVERPTTYELVINLKTAKALGLPIPRSLLARADQVIE